MWTILYRIIHIFGTGTDLSSQAVSRQVFSARMSLTSVFGMGTGGTPSPLPPEIVSSLSPHLDYCTCFRHYYLPDLLSLMIYLK